jgi:hypothetical protein
MPFPVAAVALGAVARGVAGVAVRGAARGAMTGARFGARTAARTAARTVATGAVLGGSLSSSQFGTTDPSLGNSGTAVTEPLRFGADMRVGTEK